MYRSALVFIACLLFSVLASAAAREGYYRFPAIHGNTIVFVSEGDLWSVEDKGGVARRLTTHPGLESNPAISPDGQTIAFSAQYEGPIEVYTMPISGGLPVRRTFSGQAATVVGWTPDGKILCNTTKYSGLPNTQLVAIFPDSNREEVIPLSQASDGCFDASGRHLFFTRLPFQGSYTKRYRGGTAQNLWRFTLDGEEAMPLTKDYAGTSKNPMWHQGSVYFLSDRDGTMNIWSMKENGTELLQHTFHKGLDASWPSLHEGRIVYQLVADLHLFDTHVRKDQKLKITLASDFDQMRERWVQKPLDYLTSTHLSPTGDRIVLTSRGHVFVAPALDGRWVHVTGKQGVRHRSARFFPDGKSVMLLSDETGEWEFYRFPANGVGEQERLTCDAKVIRFDGILAPDGRWLAFADKDYQLWVYNLEKKKSTKIAVSANSMFRDLAWSPDSKWLAYVQTAGNLYAQIMLYNVESRTILELTPDRVDCYNPTWSPDGKWLYFLSDRWFQSVVSSPWGSRQPEPFFDKTTKIYAVALFPEERFPFLPVDELTGETKESPGKRGDEKAAKEKGVAVEVVLAGIQDRIHEVPVAAGAYSDLAMAEKTLFWLERDSQGSSHIKLQALEIKNRNIQPKTLVEDVSGYELSLDGKRIMLRKGNDLYVIDAAALPPSQLSEKKVDLSKWTFSIDPRHEWRQMFTDAWRMERDYFYDRKMHGVDYEGLFRRYYPYLESISDRYELNDLLGHLVGELSALHTFVRGGDLRRGQEDIAAASLGVRLVPDEKNGGYRIGHIFQTDANYPERLSPMAKPEVHAREGDVITAINGTSVMSVADPALLLRNCAGQQVLLEIKSPASGQMRSVIVYPISAAAEADLRYDEWEFTRRQQVEKLGNGQIGYVHLRAMGGGNYTEWVKNFYPVYNRSGLIIDVRHNRGGNIDSWILEKLLRKAWFYWQGRVGKPTWNMQYAFRGHLVVICNERTASDGEAFAEGFRRLGLGKVIGTRTWGGEIWLSQSNVLVDRGIASAAETGVYGPEGVWLIEGHGVDPDLVVDNLPHATFLGRDAQLEAAVRYLQEKIARDPVPVPQAPPYPDKGKK